MDCLECWVNGSLSLERAVVDSIIRPLVRGKGKPFSKASREQQSDLKVRGSQSRENLRDAVPVGKQQGAAKGSRLSASIVLGFTNSSVTFQAGRFEGLSVCIFFFFFKHTVPWSPDWI